MRKLIIMRGPSGTGKSTLVRKAGLESHLLSGDKMLALLSGPWMSHDNWGVDMSQVYDSWNMVSEILDNRMRRGETIVLEGVTARLNEISNLISKARNNRYSVMIVDTSGPTIEECLERQADRKPEYLVRRPSLERQFGDYYHLPEEFAAENDVDVVMANGQPIDDVVTVMRDFVSLRSVDLSRYDSVVFIGDLQGCAEPLGRADSPVNNLDCNSIFIFTGDLLDRGTENGEVMRWAIDKFLPLLEAGRAIAIWGNHEDHLERWANGFESASQEFNRRTLPQLEAAGIEKADVRKLLSHFQDAFLMHYGNQEVIVTHGGVSGLEPFLNEDIQFALGRLASEQAMKGVGAYAATIDTEFAEASRLAEIKTSRRIVQVHGHRNSQMLPVSTDDRSFNLEGQAEFGGHIRFAVINKDGWQTIELPVTNFRGFKERQAIDAAEKRKNFSVQLPIADWIARGDKVGCISQDDIAAFGNHEHIRVQQMESRPHIATIAFNKTAFFGKVWDELTTRARGLFVNTNTGEIVSRSYDKFWNLGEKPETELAEVLKFKLPVKARHKYNGFLGIAGYDSQTDELVLSSKSMIDGDFADMFRQIALAQLGAGGLERLRRACRDLGGSAIFEVIDPARDPHMVEYDEAHIVLLDFVARSETFEKLNDEQLEQLSRYLKVPMRETLWTVPNLAALEGKLRDAVKPEGKLDRLRIEGIVLEDADGRVVKIKTPWYAMWKRARQLGEQILLARKRDKPFTKEVPEELADYIAWAHTLDDSQLDRPIIELRRYFLAGETPPKSAEQPPKEPPVNRQAEGLKRGMDALAQRGEITVESARRIYERLIDDEMKAAFNSHPLANRIRELAEEA